MILAGLPATTVMAGTSFRHHAAGADDSSVTDPDTRQYRGIDTDPHLVLDDDRASVGGTAVVGIRVVVDRYQIHFRADEYVIADGDAAAPEERATLLDEASLADSHGLAVVDIERGQYGGAFRQLFAQNLSHKFMYTLLVAYADRRKLLCCLHCGEDVGNQLFVACVIGRNHLAVQIPCENIVHNFFCFNISDAKIKRKPRNNFAARLK